MPTLIRENAAREALREHTGLRVQGAAVELLIELLTEAARQIALGAKDQVDQDGRSTILERDIRAAFEDFLASTGPSLLSPQTLYEAIEGTNDQGLKQIIDLLQQDLQQDPPRP